MIVDGTNINTFNAIVQSRRSSRQAVRTKTNIQGAPEAWRRLALGRDAPDPLTLVCEGFIDETSLSNLKDAMDEFKYRTTPNRLLVVRWSDMTDREWQGYRETLDFQDYVPGWVQTRVRFNLVIVCPDPRARDLSDTNTSTNGSLPLTREINLGTAPHPLLITIQGDSANLTNPTVTYRDYANSAVSSFTITDTLDNTEQVRVNTETHVVEKKVGAGSWTNAGGTFSGTMMEADPIHGGSSYPPSTVDVQLTGGSGESCDNFEVEYRKRWF